MRSDGWVPVDSGNIDLAGIGVIGVGNHGQPPQGVGEFLVGAIAENPIAEGIANGSVIVVFFAIGQGDRDHGVGDSPLLLAALGMVGVVTMFCKTPFDRVGWARIFGQDGF